MVLSSDLLAFILILLLYQTLSRFDIVSIIDKSSIISCIVKIHSILASTSNYDNFKFNILIMYDRNTSDNQNYTKYFYACFPENLFEFKYLDNTRFTLPILRQRKFEIPAIFIRFYIPHIFPTLKMYLYLDNDVIVTADLTNIFDYSLFNLLHSQYLKKSVITSNNQLFRNSRAADILHNRNKRKPSNFKTTTTTTASDPPRSAAISFVFEKHSHYIPYITEHFNMSQPLVKKALSHFEKDVFFNGGVALVNAVKWRKDNLTARAEAIIKMNIHGILYDEVVGDQGVFYLLFPNEVGGLPARWNMRRLPIRTIDMLNDGITGIVHFAGTTHGDAQRLCYEPVRYPVFLSAVMPLYLSVLSSFVEKCPAGGALLEYCNITAAVSTVLEELKSKNRTVTYNPGKGKFLWPPVTSYNPL